MTTPPSGKLLRQFGVTNPELVAETGIATVWKVMRENGPAALKTYKFNNSQDEWPGIELLQALNGSGAIEIYDTANAAILMEWLGGPSLGDLSRAGQDELANETLAEVGQQLHANAPTIELTDLRSRFGALFDSPKPSDDWPAVIQHQLQHCQALADRLLSTQTDIRPLHGDLHHDNIRRGPRGFLAFDAKGVIGDRAYDYANAFMNPINAPHITHDPHRIRRMAQTWGQLLSIPPGHLIDWAAAHCALSMTWSGPKASEPVFDLFGMLIAASEEAV